MASKTTGKYEAWPMFGKGDNSLDPRYVISDPDGKWIALTCAGNDEENAKKIAEALNRMDERRTK
jgi:hypothetical protein